MRPSNLSAALLVCLATVPSPSQTAVGVSAQTGNFHLAVSSFFGVPNREVVVIRERRIPDDEIPLALFISQQARVPPASVVELRTRGKSWWDISIHFGVGPEVYYVPVTIAPGPPYGKAYGYYKKKPRKQWRTIVLSDPDLINLANLRFLSGYHRLPPERVMELRGGNRGFIAVHTELGGWRHSPQIVAVGKSDGGNGHGGKGKGKGHNR